MLKGCTSLRTLSFAGVATSSVTDMSSMFEGCTSLSAVDIAGLDTSSASNMNAMFKGCTSLSGLDLSRNNLARAHGRELDVRGLQRLRHRSSSPAMPTQRTSET